MERLKTLSTWKMTLTLIYWIQDRNWNDMKTSLMKIWTFVEVAEAVLKVFLYKVAILEKETLEDSIDVAVDFLEIVDEKYKDDVEDWSSFHSQLKRPVLEDEIGLDEELGGHNLKAKAILEQKSSYKNIPNILLKAIFLRTPLNNTSKIRFNGFLC